MLRWRVDNHRVTHDQPVLRLATLTVEDVDAVDALIALACASSGPIDPREDEQDDSHQAGGDRDDQKQLGH